MSKEEISQLDLVAVIAEGGAEQAIMEILYDNDLLIFDQLLDDEIIRMRTARKFAETYLTKDFDDMSVGIVRILDSPKERFKLPKEHADIPVFNVLTRPEIEMLILISLGEDQRYTNRSSRQTIHDYLKRTKKVTGNLKSQQFIKEHFASKEHLIECIEIYHAKYHDKKLGLSLKDILKDSCQ